MIDQKNVLKKGKPVPFVGTQNVRHFGVPYELLESL